jgi:F-type H+-transporting ATPase subunit gamma
MEMVAAAQLRKAQIRAEQTRPYATKLKEMLDNFPSNELSHPLLQERPVKKIFLLVIGSDRGLCGSYNFNVLSKADQFLKKYSAEQVELIPIGRKIVDYYSNTNWQIRYRITMWDKIPYHDIAQLGNMLINAFIAEECDAVWITYTEYINVMNRKVHIEQLLPLDKTLVHKSGKSGEAILEPSGDSLFAELLPRYAASKIQAALFESYASELAARILSMKTATNNAEEMILDLRLQSNKIRQASITREIAEISNGAQSLT